MSFITDHKTISFFILLILVLGICSAIFFLIKFKNRVKLSKTMINNTIKPIKQLIRKNRLKKKTNSLFIFYGEYSSARDYLNKIKPNSEIFDYGNLSLVAADEDSLCLLFNFNDIDNIKKLKNKLKLKFHKINLCFDISSAQNYQPGQIKSVSETFSKHEIKAFIVSFYNNNANGNIDSFNKIIGNNSIYEITRDIQIDKKIDKIICSKILRSNDALNKYFNFKTFNYIKQTNSGIYNELKNIDRKVFLDFRVNSLDYIPIKTSQIFSASPKTLIVNLISLCFSLVFIINIYQQLELKKQITFENINKSSNEELTSIVSQYKKKVNNALLLDSVYPDNLKYGYIYEQYANIVLKNILEKKFDTVNNLSTITAFLIYFEYVNNSHIDTNSKNIAKIISSLTEPTQKQLLTVIKYANSKTKHEVLKHIYATTEKLYNSGQIKSTLGSKDYLSTQKFNEQYLSISDRKRTQLINSIYIKYLYRCTISNIIPQFESDFIVPPIVNKILTNYQNDTQSYSKHSCNSSFVNLVTENISTIQNQENNQENFKSFNDMFKNVNKVIDTLITNSEKASITNKKESEKITNSLINYVLNTDVNSSYNDNILPLTTPVSKDLYMSFSPNFYDKQIQISPVYSKQFISGSIEPLTKEFNSFIKNLENKHHITPSFMLSIYKNSIHNYQQNYIAAYNDMIDDLNNDSSFDQQEFNKGSLDLYLSAMSSNDSSFNNLISFYKNNTDIPKKEKTVSRTIEDKIQNKISIKFSSKETKQSNTLENIQNYFKNNDDYLNSKKYQNYMSVFKQLNEFIRKDGYAKTYEKINKGFNPLKKAYSDLSDINTKNNNLYVLLKKHLDIAVRAIRFIALEDAINGLSNSINLEYSSINNEFPFNRNSDQIVSDESLNDMLSKSGNIYSELTTNLEPLFTYNKISSKWQDNSLATSTHQQQEYLDRLNKVYALNKLLWDSQNNPKKVEFNVTPIAETQDDYTFFSIILDKKDFVNSLNINYSDSSKLMYDWNSDVSTTIIVKFPDGTTSEKSYQGKWSILKALNDAQCNSQNICTWKVEHKGKLYPVTFKIESQLINILGWKEGKTNDK